jgi:uncharacterized protein (DUF302 family)
MDTFSKKIKSSALLGCLIIAILGCDSSSIPPERYQQSDALIQTISSNLKKAPYLTEEIKVDHSRLASAKGQPFPPTQVIIFNNDNLEAKMLHQKQILALDMPLRILAYESSRDQKNSVVWNEIDYIESRYNINFSDEIVSQYNKSMKAATEEIPAKFITHFSTNTMKKSGITTLNSRHSFDDTYQKSLAIIKSNSDVVIFDEIDFQAKALSQDVSIGKTKLILFGAPKPGGKSMADAQTLGLDAFPQKYLVWQDGDGVHVSYNNLTEIADRQNTKKSIALRIIQYRLDSSFKKGFDEP